MVHKCFKIASFETFKSLTNLNLGHPILNTWMLYRGSISIPQLVRAGIIVSRCRICGSISIPQLVRAGLHSLILDDLKYGTHFHRVSSYEERFDTDGIKHAFDPIKT